MDFKTSIRVSGIIEESIVDGPGVRLVIFSQGCPHQCKGCHNPETHAMDGGKLITVKEILDMVKENPLLDGVTFSGGEPFEQAVEFAFLAKELRKLGMGIITYTGYVLEDLIKLNKDGYKQLLEETDTLVDGPYVEEQRSLGLTFKGSKNQRIIDVKRDIEV